MSQFLQAQVTFIRVEWVLPFATVLGHDSESVFKFKVITAGVMAWHTIHVRILKINLIISAI